MIICDNKTMSQLEEPVSGSDIYHKLGTLEGKMDSLIAKTDEYKSDLRVAFDRIRQLENRMSWILGGAVVISSLVPIVVNIITGILETKVDNKEAQKIEYIRNI
jgi:hypothetical protein